MYMPGIATEGTQKRGDGSGAALAILDPTPQPVQGRSVGRGAAASSEDLTIWKKIIPKAYQ